METQEKEEAQETELGVSILEEKPELYEPSYVDKLEQDAAYFQDYNAYTNVDFPYYQQQYARYGESPMPEIKKKKKKKRSFWGNVRKGFSDFNKVYRKIVPKEVRNFGNAIIPGASLVDDMCSGIGQLGSNPKKFAKRFASEDWWFQATMTGIGEGMKYAFFGVPAAAGYVGGRVGGIVGKEIGGAKGEMWGGIVGGTVGYAGGAAHQGAKFSTALAQSAAMTGTIQTTTYAGQKIGEETIGGYEGAAVGASIGQLAGMGAVMYGGAVPKGKVTLAQANKNGVKATVKQPLN
jgi:hypothetical protein